MTALRWVSWLATAAVLVVIRILAPRLTPAGDVDPLPRRTSLQEPVKVSGGTVTVDRVLAAPRWTDGDETLSLEGKGAHEGKGLFVEVKAQARPDRRATSLRATIRSHGRTYKPSSRAGLSSDAAEAGFTSPQVITFEVPPDVVDGGSVWVGFTESSSARIELNADTVERTAVLEQIQ